MPEENLASPEEEGNANKKDEGGAAEGASDVVQQSLKQVVETFGFQSGPVHNPVLVGISKDPNLIGKFLDHSHNQEQHKTWIAAGVVALVVIAIVALCWLFLAYGYAEHLDAIIGGVIGMLGGFGAGWAYGKARLE